MVSESIIHFRVRIFIMIVVGHILKVFPLKNIPHFILLKNPSLSPLFGNAIHKQCFQHIVCFSFVQKNVFMPMNEKNFFLGSVMHKRHLIHLMNIGWKWKRFIEVDSKKKSKHKYFVKIFSVIYKRLL